MIFRNEKRTMEIIMIKASKKRIFLATLFDFLIMYTALYLALYLFGLHNNGLAVFIAAIIIPIIAIIITIKKNSFGKFILSINLDKSHENKKVLTVTEDIKNREHFFIMFTGMLFTWTGFNEITKWIDGFPANPFFALDIPKNFEPYYLVLLGCTYVYTGYNLLKLNKTGLYLFLFFSLNALVSSTIGFDIMLETYREKQIATSELTGLPFRESKIEQMKEMKSFLIVFMTVIITIWVFFILRLKKRFI